MSDLQWARVSNDAFNVALFAYVAAMVGYFAYLAFRRTRSGAIASTVAWSGSSRTSVGRRARVRRRPRAVGQHVRVLLAAGAADGRRRTW